MRGSRLKMERKQVVLLTIIQKALELEPSFLGFDELPVAGPNADAATRRKVDDAYHRWLVDKAYRCSHRPSHEPPNRTSVRVQPPPTPHP